MGTFLGHIVPGTMFILIGLWWSLATSVRFTLSANRHSRYLASTSMPCFLLPFSKLQRAPVETYLKLFLFTVGIIGEAYTGLKTQPTRHFEIDNAQHITAYFIFFMAALVELLVQTKLQLPKRLDHAFSCAAFAIEAFIFANHLHARSMLDTHLHTLFVYAIYGCLVSAALETARPGQILFTYSRILFTLLQGDLIKPCLFLDDSGSLMLLAI